MRLHTALFVTFCFLALLALGSLIGEAAMHVEEPLPVRTVALDMDRLPPQPPVSARPAARPPRLPDDPFTADSAAFAPDSTLPYPLPADGLRLPVAPAEPERGFSHLGASGSRPSAGASARAAFSLKVNDIVTPYRVQGVFAMPGETVSIEPVLGQPGAAYIVRSDHGRVAQTPDGWHWTAPDQPGAYAVWVEGASERMQINVLVKTPFDNGDVLQGYRIGGYESQPLRGDPAFLPPEGLIEVSDATADVRVSPHFTLGMFTCHQPGDPKFVALDERLLLKLEMLLEEVNRRGIPARTFTVMSAYRTPWYNASIGNTTKYSLHLFGRAADIFIDDDGDGRMDDLNRDGTVDEADARLLYDLVDSLKGESWYKPFVGGLGLYGPKPHRGPFIHVDVRGTPTRW